MKKIIALAAAGTLLTLFSVSSIANAEVSVTVGAGASGSSASSATGVTLHGNANASAEDSDTNGADTDADTADSNDDSVSADTAASSATGVSFSLTQKDAASASIDAESAELDSSAVITSNDLSDFTTSRMKRDTNIENVNAASDRVRLEYKKKAHFLGFIPGSIRATADVSSDGSVDVDYPWYRFLFSVDGNDSAKADLQARVQELMASADVHAGFSAQLEAELIEAMHMALQGSGSVSSSVDARSGTTADMAGMDGSATATGNAAANATSGANVYPN